MYWRKIIKAIFVFVFLSSCIDKKDKLPYYNTPDFTPLWNVADSDTIHSIASFSFKDQNGEAITNETVKDKIYITNFFFTTCSSICPNMMHNLKAVSDTFEKDNDVLILSHSVMPWVDSVTQLKKYADDQQINNPNWHLLTGSKSQIYSLARTSYFAEEELGFTKDSTQFLHTEYVLLVDKNKHIRGIYKGTLPLEMKRIIQDIYLLKKED